LRTTGSRRRNLWRLKAVLSDERTSFVVRAVVSVRRARRGGIATLVGESMLTTRPPVTPDDLDAWIAELRGRLARRELDGLGQWDEAGGTLSADLVVSIMLADLDHYDDLAPEQREAPSIVARRDLLVQDFQRLRERIG
jgi:hypothetical protein